MVELGAAVSPDLRRPGRFRQPASRVRTLAVDLLAAVAVASLDPLVSWRPGDRGDVPLWAVPAYSLLLAVPLARRRRWPIPVFAIAVAHSVVGHLAFPSYVPTLGVWLALYAVASRCALRPALACLAAAAIPAAANVADAVGRQPEAARADALIGTVVVLVVLNALIFGVGRWTAWSVVQRRLVAESAAAHAVAVERARIARDLHDVVAHAITAMTLSAGAAARLIPTQPERALGLLATVDESGDQAILELRRMLALLRPDDTQADGDAALPGAENLPELVARMRDAGIEVVETVTGAAEQRLDPGASLSLYRVVAEALTNAARHGDPSRPVEVDLGWGPETVEVCVRNRMGSRRPAARRLSTGHGLIGMRERVHAVDGQITLGPDGDDEWVVRAAFPVTG